MPTPATRGGHRNHAAPRARPEKRSRSWFSGRLAVFTAVKRARGWSPAVIRSPLVERPMLSGRDLEWSSALDSQTHATECPSPSHWRSVGRICTACPYDRAEAVFNLPMKRTGSSLRARQAKSLPEKLTVRRILAPSSSLSPLPRLRTARLGPICNHSLQPRDQLATSGFRALLTTSGTAAREAL